MFCFDDLRHSQQFLGHVGTNKHCPQANSTVVPTKSDSDVIFCLQM